jgi:hypothetical protein
MRPKREAENLPLSSADFKDSWSFTPYFSRRSNALVVGFLAKLMKI